MRAAIVALALLLAGCPGSAHKRVHGPGGGGDVGDQVGDVEDDAPDGGGAPEVKDAAKDEAKEEDAPPPPPGTEVAAKSEAKRKTKPTTGRAPARIGERVAGIERSEDEREALIAPRLTAARNALAGGDLERAINEARRGLDLQTDHIGALGLLAEAYYRKGWYPKALRILRRGTGYARGKDDAQLWMLLGLVLDRTEAPHAERLEAYERTTKLKPNYARAWNNLGVIHLRMQQYPSAMAALETAVSIDPDSAAAFTNLGTAYRRHAFEGQTVARTRTELLRKAERAYRTAIALDEEQAAAYLDLGLLYLDTDSFPGMTSELRLQASVRYLREYKQRSSRPGAGGPDVDAYLQAAQRQLDGLLRRTRSKK